MSSSCYLSPSTEWSSCNQTTTSTSSCCSSSSLYTSLIKYRWLIYQTDGKHFHHSIISVINFNQDQFKSHHLKILCFWHGITKDTEENSKHDLIFWNKQNQFINHKIIFINPALDQPASPPGYNWPDSWLYQLICTASDSK